jgi:Fe-S-cluster containining protein
MGYTDTFDQTDFNLERTSPFSYRCNACSRCCHHKAIRVGAHEILRLARRLGMSTTNFIAHHTEAGGTVLRTSNENDSACIFLTPRGCGVHPDRPLVCRIYPLALWVDLEGRESFGRAIPHPETAGIYGMDGTVADFLDQQGIAPYFAMKDRYNAVYHRMVDALERLDPEELDRHLSRREAIDETEPGLAASPWIDIDLTVAEFCKANARPVPADIEGLVVVHIEAIEAWIASLSNPHAGEPQS